MYSLEREYVRLSRTKKEMYQKNQQEHGFMAFLFVFKNFKGFH